MEVLNTDASKPIRGLSSSTPENIPQGMYPFALNTITQDDNLASEKGNQMCGEFPEGYIIIGNRYTNDGRNIVALVSEDEAYSEFGIVNKSCEYTTVVNSTKLGFRLNHQIDIRYRLRRGCEDVIYFTDGNRSVGFFNFAKPEGFYNNTYKDFLKSGASVYTGEKWDAKNFNLFPSYKVPCISDMIVGTGGQLRSGSYNFAIQYLDDNLNPTNFIYTSQIIPIFESALSSNYGDIVGSSNLDSDDLAGTVPTNKSIKLIISGLDPTFKFYKVAVIEATSKTGKVTRAILSPNIPIDRTEYVYDGNTQGYTDINEQELALSKTDISVAEHIEQFENKLILSKTKGKQVEYCGFQKYASKISSNYVIREAAATDIDDPGSSKSPNTMWERQGYMGGEVYPYGIVYVFDDGLESSVGHIPGRPAGYHRDAISGLVVAVPNDTAVVPTWTKDVAFIEPVEAVYNGLAADKKARRFEVFDTSLNRSNIPSGTGNSYGAMSYHENTNVFYEPRADCNEGDYWGYDACGIPLTGKPVRHHKFPGRTKEPHVRPGGVFDGVTGLYLDINLIEGKTLPDGVLNITINYEVEGVPDSRVIRYEAGASDFPVSRFLIIGANASFEGIVILDATGNIVDQPEIFTYRLYKEEVPAEFKDTGVVRNFGIQFGNIEYPHPDIVGHYFVRGQRDDQNRLVLDKGFSGRLRKKGIGGQTYHSFGYFNGDTNEESDINYLFTPRLQYNKETLNGSYLKYEGAFVANNSYVASREEDGEGSKFKEINNVIEYRNKSFSEFDKGTGDQNFSIYKSTTLNAVDKNTSYVGVDSPVYNLSWSNRVKIVSTRQLMPLVYQKNLSYVSYNVHRNVHPVLDDIKYQRIHNCILTPANSNRVFGGDIFISRWDIANSLYRKKKKGILKSLLNIVLLAAAAAATIATAGISAPLLVAAAGAAIAAGIATAIVVTAVLSAVIGVTAQAIELITTEIESKGLDQLTADGEFDRATGTGTRLSSYIAYANEMMAGLYVESEVNVSLSQEENHLCGAKFRFQSGLYEYFRSRWLYFDQETEKWTPKGFCCPETYNYNKDYSRENTQSTYFALPATYDCCSDCKESHPFRTYWSETAFQEEMTDNYRVFKPNNYRDIEGEHGGITNIIKRNNNLFIQTSEALWRLPQSNQERVTNEIVTFIGTGDFFSINPQKIVDAAIGTAGTQHKWATMNSIVGLLIVNEIEGKIYLFDNGFSIISDAGEATWFKENLKDNFGKQYKELTDADFPNQNNNANSFGIGIHSTYDAADEDNRRILITKRDYLLLPEYQENFKIVASEKGIISGSLTLGKLVFDTTASKFAFITGLGADNGIVGNSYAIDYVKSGYVGSNGLAESTYEYIDFNDARFFENKSWTKSYSINDKSWTSYHSYIPNYYMYTHNDFYSFITSSSGIWKHNIEGIYSNFYGKQYPHIIEQVLTADRLTTMYWSDLSLGTLALKYDQASKTFVEARDVTFNKLTAYNNRQSTGELKIKPKTDFDDKDYMEAQVSDEIGVVIASRNEKDWAINDLLDYVVDPALPIFLKSWEGLKSQYFIDKVVNQVNINYSKDWTEVESLRDKYLIVRLKFDNFTDVQLITKFLLDTKAISFK